MRRLVRETDVLPRHMVQPLFFKEGSTGSVPVPSMPSVAQHDLDELRRHSTAAVAAGVGGIMLFAVPRERDALGSGAWDPQGALNQAVRAVKAEVGESTVVIADLCLDEFSDHGHCGVVRTDGVVDNDETVAHYQRMALALAEAGADVVAPSGMMDGQVGAIRDVLDHGGYSDVAILAYAAKYASAFYGPFRDAVESTLVGDRRTYQQDPTNRREAQREIALDIAETADMVMVKPALAYLDVVAAAATVSPVPVWAYQVSGELAMVEAAAERGWLDRQATILETLTAIRRAGADTVISYWATEAAQWL